MRQTDKSLQSEKFKQVVGGLGRPLGKSPAPDRIQYPRDLDRSFPCWPGSGYFWDGPRGCAVHSSGATPLPTGDPRPPQLRVMGSGWVGSGLVLSGEVGWSRVV